MDIAKPTPADQELRAVLAERPDDAIEVLLSHVPELDEDTISFLWTTGDPTERDQAVDQLIAATARAFTLTQAQAIRICRRTWGA